MFGVPKINSTIDDALAQFIGEKLQQNLPAALRERMKDKIGYDYGHSKFTCNFWTQQSFLNCQVWN